MGGGGLPLFHIGDGASYMTGIKRQIGKIDITRRNT